MAFLHYYLDCALCSLQPPSSKGTPNIKFLRGCSHGMWTTVLPSVSLPLRCYHNCRGGSVSKKTFGLSSVSGGPSRSSKLERGSWVHWVPQVKFQSAQFSCFLPISTPFWKTCYPWYPITLWERGSTHLGQGHMYTKNKQTQKKHIDSHLWVFLLSLFNNFRDLHPAILALKLPRGTQNTNMPQLVLCVQIYKIIEKETWII